MQEKYMQLYNITKNQDLEYLLSILGKFHTLDTLINFI